MTARVFVMSSKARCFFSVKSANSAMFGGSVNHRAQAKQDGYTKNDREIDDFRHRSRPERSALQRLRGEVRLGKLQRIAEITQHVIERLPVLHPFGNVRAELLRDLI